MPRTAIVTGGAKGIGRAISARLAASGWSLVVCGRDDRALSQAAAELRARHGVEVEAVTLDLSRPGSVEALFARWGGPGELPAAMICNASDYGVLGPLGEVDFATWKQSFDLNFFAVAEMIHRYVGIARAGGPGTHRRIVVMGGGGLGGAQVSGGISAYSCAKAALNRLVEVIHEEVRALGIDVNCVLPGLVATGIVDQAIAAGPEKLGPLYHASLKARQEGGTSPDLVADLIADLLRDESRGLSGRLLSARWDRDAIRSPAMVIEDPDLFRLRRVDRELFGKLK